MHQPAICQTSARPPALLLLTPRRLPAPPLAQSGKWRQDTADLAVVLGILLEQGSGLTVGPDSDGILNLQDTPDAEVEATASRAGRRRQFDVSRVLAAVAPDAAAPLAAAPAGLRSVAKQYQLRGLAWMLGRERRGDAVGRGCLHLHPAWSQLLAADGTPLYVHNMAPHLLSTDFYTGECRGNSTAVVGGPAVDALDVAASPFSSSIFRHSLAPI